ncbi:MAG: hypothetical protein H6898_04785 [Rhodobacter sp.]|nr:hypothetical protein [Paracoccaceae bacterium]MCC0075886.1 hypothetical protein [Rhodobacter sp.]
MTSRPRKPRRARILPGLALLFLLGASLKLTTGLGAAMAQDPAPEPVIPHTAPSPLPPAPQLLQASVAGNAELIVDLRRREQALDAREAAVAERAALVEAGQVRLQDQIAALQAAEGELAATMALADRAAEDDITRLVSVFEAMKPEDAAAVFAEMDAGFAAGFLARLAPQTAADILAGLEPRQAYGLSAILAGRNANVPRD